MGTQQWPKYLKMAKDFRDYKKDEVVRLVKDIYVSTSKSMSTQKSIMAEMYDEAPQLFVNINFEEKEKQFCDKIGVDVEAFKKCFNVIADNFFHAHTERDVIYSEMIMEPAGSQRNPDLH